MWLCFQASKRGIIFEPIKPLTAVLLQQIDILGASPNWLGRPYWPSGTACYGWTEPRPGGLTLRLRDSWGTGVRGWPPAISVPTLAWLLVSRSLPKRSGKRTLCDMHNALPTEGTALDATGHRQLASMR
jgi:hypothetical protein